MTIKIESDRLTVTARGTQQEMVFQYREGNQLVVSVVDGDTIYPLPEVTDADIFMQGLQAIKTTQENARRRKR